MALSKAEKEAIEYMLNQLGKKKALELNRKRWEKILLQEKSWRIGGKISMN